MSLQCAHNKKYKYKSNTAQHSSAHSTALTQQIVTAQHAVALHQLGTRLGRDHGIQRARKLDVPLHLLARKRHVFRCALQAALFVHAC